MNDSGDPCWGQSGPKWKVLRDGEGRHYLVYGPRRPVADNKWLAVCELRAGLRAAKRLNTQGIGYEVWPAMSILDEESRAGQGAS